MTESSVPDLPETSDAPPLTRGPLAFILAEMRGPANTAIMRLSQLASAGTLNPQQVACYNEILAALEKINRVVEQYAPTADDRKVRVARSEAWTAGEQSDALDDRYQDDEQPLSDAPHRDQEHT